MKFMVNLKTVSTMCAKWGDKTLQFHELLVVGKAVA